MLAAATGRKLSTPLTASRFLSLLRECKTTVHLKLLHSLFVTGGLSLDAFCTTKFLLRHATASWRSHEVNYSSLVLKQIKAHSAFFWNTMIRVFSTGSHHEKSVAFFAEMLREGVVPDRHTYPLLLKAFAKSNNRNPGQIHAQVLKFGMDTDPFVQNSLVSCYAKGGYLGCAAQLFDKISQKDSISWTAMIHGFVRNNMAEEGLDLFVEMRSSGIKVDEVTVVSVLCGSGILGSIWFGRCIHGFYVECGRVKWDVYVGSALIDMYARCGYSDDAQKAFDKIPCRNVVCWSALIAGHVQCSRFNAALCVFHDMLIQGSLPNQATLTSVLTACAQLGALDQGRWVHGYIDRNKLGLNSVIGTALIDMYAKCGCIDQALTVFRGLPKKDIYPWTGMINGLAMHGCALDSLDLFSCMLEERVLPNEVTFLGVLAACSHGGLVDQGKMFFDHMALVYGIKPKMEHYGCMVDLLGRAGRVEEALCLIKSMPMEPSPGVWGALYSACMIHKNFPLGESIGKHLIQRQPHHSGRYALLANMYSVSRNWQEAAHVRMQMKGRGVEKIPGCSYIEVNGAIHEFIAMDMSHSQSKDIYQMLDGMVLQLDGSLLLFEMDAG